MESTNQQKTVLVAGHICLDIIPDLSMGKSLGELKPGSLSVIGAVQTATGGVVSNTGLALHRLGQPVRLSAKIGDDEFGALIRNKFESIDAGLGKDFILDQQTNTSYSLVLSPGSLDRHFLHHPGANDTLLSNDLPDQAFAGVDLMHFGYPPLLAAMVANEGAELEALLKRSRAAGTLNSLDMASVDPNSAVGKLDWPTILKRTLPNVDLFIPSLDEIAFMLGESVDNEVPRLEELRHVAQRLLDYGAGMVGLKLGEFGIYFKTSDQIEKLTGLEKLGQSPHEWQDLEMMQPCFQVDVIGTTGAGDCTIAGFIAALCRGVNPTSCLEIACGVGACNVEAADAHSGLLSWDETLDRIQQGWALNDNRIMEWNPRNETCD